jgi:hypothetical protein
MQSCTAAVVTNQPRDSGMIRQLICLAVRMQGMQPCSITEAMALKVGLDASLENAGEVTTRYEASFSD